MTRLLGLIPSLSLAPLLPCCRGSEREVWSSAVLCSALLCVACVTQNALSLATPSLGVCSPDFAFLSESQCLRDKMRWRQQEKLSITRAHPHTHRSDQPPVRLTLATLPACACVLSLQTPLRAFPSCVRVSSPSLAVDLPVPVCVPVTRSSGVGCRRASSLATCLPVCVSQQFSLQVCLTTRVRESRSVLEKVRGEGCVSVCV